MKHLLSLVSMINMAFAPLAAQVNAIVYVDVSNQSGRTRIVEKVDSIIGSYDSKTLVMVSNGSSPLFEFTNTPQQTYERAILVNNPSSPSPFFDLDTLFNLIELNGGLSLSANIYFFLGEFNAGAREIQGETIFEKFLLIGQFVNKGELTKSAKAILFLNPQIEITASGEEIMLNGNYQCIIKGVNSKLL